MHVSHLQSPCRHRKPQLQLGIAGAATTDLPAVLRADGAAAAEAEHTRDQRARQAAQGSQGAGGTVVAGGCSAHRVLPQRAQRAAHAGEPGTVLCCCAVLCEHPGGQRFDVGAIIGFY